MEGVLAAEEVVVEGGEEEVAVVAPRLPARLDRLDRLDRLARPADLLEVHQEVEGQEGKFARTFVQDPDG